MLKTPLLHENIFLINPKQTLCHPKYWGLYDSRGHPAAEVCIIFMQITKLCQAVTETHTLIHARKLKVSDPQGPLDGSIRGYI